MVWPAIVDYNNYYRACTWRYNRNLGSEATYTSLAAWQANSHSPDAHSISTDPLFVSAGGSTAVSYKLQGGSPALTGSSTGGQMGAYEGNPCIGYGCTASTTAPGRSVNANIRAENDLAMAVRIQ